MCKTFILPTRLILGILRGRYKHGRRRVEGIFEVNLAFYWFIVQSYTVYGHFCCSVRCTFAGSFNENPNSQSLRTLICNTFDRRSSKFPTEYLSLLLKWFNHFLLSLFLLHSILVSSFYLNVNIVVLYQFTVTCIEILSVRSLGRPRIKSSRLRLFFDGVPEKIACSRPSTIWTPGAGYREERNGFVKADVK